jgi:hypothetical protein
MRATHASTVEARIVVRGAVAPRSVWPEERTLPTPVAVRRAAEVGDPEQVVALLAAAEGTDAATYLQSHGGDVASIRALTAHCEAAILQAALAVRGDLSPAAVVAVLHKDLTAHKDRRRELLDLLAS